MRKEYEFKAVSKDGEVLSGVLEASSHQVATRKITAEQLMILSLEEARDLSLEQRLTLFFRFGYPKDSELINFLEQSSQLLKAGVSVHDVFQMILKTLTNKVFIATLEDVHAQLSSGHSLSFCLSKHPDVFPKILITMVKVGEQTGDLSEAFDRARRFLAFEGKLKNKVAASLRYPFFILALICVAIVVISVYVLPGIEDFFSASGEELPWLTEIILGVASVIREDYTTILKLFAAALALFVLWKSSDKGDYTWAEYKFYLPVVGNFFHKVLIGRFCRSLSLLLEAKVSLVDALTSLSQSMENTFLRVKIVQMREGLKSGQSLVQVAQKAEVFSDLVLQMLSIGDRTGQLEGMLEKVANQYDGELKHDLTKLTVIVENLLIVFVGSMVLVLALSVFIPMMDMTSMAIKKAG